MLQTDLMTEQIIAHAKACQPDYIVVLGDVLDRFDKTTIDTTCRAMHLLRGLRPLSKHLYLLIGNHDRPNNNDFLTDQHSFNALKEWANTTVVDKVVTANLGGLKCTFVPYVHTGRFSEALATADLKAPYKDLDVIFAHQEFKGASMNKITSSEGDDWKLDYPLVCSGHIHDRQILQHNLIYVGTPIQHGFAENAGKGISLFEFTVGTTSVAMTWTEKRLAIRIPRKIRIMLTAEEFVKFKVPEDTHVRIKVSCPVVQYNELLKLDHVKALIAMPGVIVLNYDTTPPVKSTSGTTSGAVKVKCTFTTRLANILKLEDATIQTTFAHVFRS